MHGASLEQLFASFRSTGDPDALGAVFDATAPKLLLLAAHLTGDGAIAEDVVQATFLRAMERAAEFDARRPLWPWLVGILANEAKMELRRRSRRVDPRRVPAKAALDPSEAAVAEEIAQHVARAVETMPEPFRAVLRLRLVHGFSHPQIAHALGIPVATARTRLHRGLAQLREALPAGLAAAVALCAGERGLAAVRGVVMQRAAGVSSPALAAAGSTAHVARPSRAWASLAAGFAVAAAAIAIAWSAGSAPPPERTSASAPRAVAAAAARNPDAAPAGAPRAALPTEAEDITWELRGRITGHAAAGARVRAQATRGEVVTDLGEARAGAVGSYRIDVGALRAMTVLQRATAGLCIAVTAEGAQPASVRSREEIPLEVAAPHVFELDATLERAGPTLSGRVVTAAHEPVAGAEIKLRLEDPERRPFRAREWNASSDSTGRFSFSLEHAGDYRVAAGSPSGGVGSRTLQVTSVDRSLELDDLVLEVASSLEGRLVMQDGTPVPHCQLYVRPWQGKTTYGGKMFLWSLPVPAVDTTTDAEGRFRVGVLAPGHYAVRVADAGRDDAGAGGRDRSRSVRADAVGSAPHAARHRHAERAAARSRDRRARLARRERARAGCDRLGRERRAFARRAAVRPRVRRKRDQCIRDPDLLPAVGKHVAVRRERARRRPGERDVDRGARCRERGPGPAAAFARSDGPPDRRSRRRHGSGAAELRRRDRRGAHRRRRRAAARGRARVRLGPRPLSRHGVLGPGDLWHARQPDRERDGGRARR